MPGKSQIEKFSSDLLSLGDEVGLRAARGEQPVKIAIPKDISDENDGDEFIGWEPDENVPEEAPVVEEEDFSDLTSLVNPDSASSGNEDAPAPSFEAPDMSGLLNSFEAVDTGDGDMPDLSMFNDEPEEEEVEEVVPEEPEEIPISDLGLDALLSSGGFDQSEEEEEPEEDNGAEAGLEEVPVEEQPTLVDDLNRYDNNKTSIDDDIEDIPSLDEEDPFKGEDPFNFDLSSNPDPYNKTSPNKEEHDDPFNFSTNGSEEDPFNFDNDANPIQDLGNDLDIVESPKDDSFETIPNLDDVEDIEELDELDEDEGGLIDDLNLGDSDEDLETPASEETKEETTVPESKDDEDESFGDIPVTEDNFEISDIPSMDEIPEMEEEGAKENEEIEDLDSLAEDLGESLEDKGTSDDVSDLGDLDDFNIDGMDVPIDEMSTDGLDDMPAATEEPKAEESETPSDDLGDIDISELGDLDNLSSAEEEKTTENGYSADDFSIPEDDGISNDVPEFSDLGLDDIGDLGEAETPSMDEEDTKAPEGLFDANDVEVAVDDEIPDIDDYGTDMDLGGTSPFDMDEESTEEPIETFDTSEMDGLDFGIPDTDEQLSSLDDDSSFDVPKDEDSEFSFEIPGFSDVDSIKDQKSSSPVLSSTKNKKQKPKKVEEEEEENEDELPEYTLSDKQYRTFRKNFSQYPLNVRLAFENFIVADEVTEDDEFSIIQMVLNKEPARQVAKELEKRLDISIPVPRDYEHRSAEEYEAYKKSISYQLRNKIIPGLLLGLAAVIVCFGLFNFGKNCIYKPIKANNLYSQGYVLLQESEYPLSEVKFEEATKYRLNKKWFYKYARGYRKHKQYQRAGKMYQNILYCFKHEKEAGLEYADMELNDLANYPRAEEIVRREILDYHINDPDGILMLGDVFLEWATEKDPSKFEMAREQYATLINLYGANDLYLSRMMRYFIRTDNLREVLQLKQNFEPREKSLCADDWTELSGYLLDKYYGELAPSDEYLRYQIEGLRGLLLRAVKMNPNNPIALYNLGRYFIETNEYEFIEQTLQDSIEKFNAAEKMKSRDIYKYIDAYRLLGEHYISKDNYLQAQEQFAEGISLYIAERDNAGFKGTPKIGKLYEDMGDIKYTVSGEYDDAHFNYSQSVKLGNDSPKIRYRLGYINYNNREYEQALDSFMKAGDGYIKERNLLLAMANTLSLRGDDYAAEGYYEQLMEALDNEIASEGLLIPQADADDYDLVSTYLYGANNYGVTLHRLAKKTGDSSKNAKAIVQLSESLKAWDALTRNPETMVRLEGTNLAEQNIKYITHPFPEFEPEIYTNISKTLLDTEKL